MYFFFSISQVFMAIFTSTFFFFFFLGGGGGGNEQYLRNCNRLRSFSIQELCSCKQTFQAVWVFGGFDTTKHLEMLKWSLCNFLKNGSYKIC